MTWIEVLGFVTGAVSVAFAVRERLELASRDCEQRFFLPPLLESEAVRGRASPDCVRSHLNLRLVELASRRGRPLEAPHHKNARADRVAALNCHGACNRGDDLRST